MSVEENPTHLATWKTSMMLWGWVILSDEDCGSSMRNPALVLEGRDTFQIYSHTWDDKPDGHIYEGEHEYAIPDWWALHHLPLDWMTKAIEQEHLFRQAQRAVENAI